MGSTMQKRRNFLRLLSNVPLWRWGILPAFLIIFMAAGNASAQMFGASSGFSNNQPTAVRQLPTAGSATAARRQTVSSSNPQTAPAQTTQPDAQVDDEAAAKARLALEPMPPADMASENQNSAPSILQLRFIGNKPVIDDSPKIMLYMRDFKVANNLNGRPSCTMRFYILSSAPEKITNISYRLKWPKMETALSFDDVAPNTPTYFDYALLGNGCYSMDKAPNIIVNRCRIKGMSQRQCADAIQWME